MSSTLGRCGRKRPLCTISESSSTSTVENEPSLKPKLCGGCLNPLNSPPLSKVVRESSQRIRKLAGVVCLQNIFVTCTNHTSSKSVCNAALHNSSPHFHLGCSGIPTGSKLFSDLMQNLEKSESREKTDRGSDTNSSMTHIPLPLLTREIKSTVPHDKGIMRTGLISNDNKDDTCETLTETETCTVDCAGTSIVSPPISRRGSFENKTNKTFIQPFKIDDDRYTFLCPFCDVQGSSQYLQEYFSSFRAQKVDYYALEESRDFPPACFSRNKPTKSAANNDKRRDSCFMDYLIQQQDNLGFSCGKTELQLDHIQNIMGCIRRCDNGVQEKEVCEAGCVETTKVSSLRSPLKKRNKTKGQSAGDYMKTTKAGTYILKQQLRIELDEKNTNKLPPLNVTFLVGQPVRLFCKIDNTYHVGRIIDWRIWNESQFIYSTDSTKTKDRQGEFGMEREINQDFILDQDIGRTQFFVRFRAGIEGRKAAVHEWLFLEEHPLMVGLALVWAHSDNDDRAQSRRHGKNRTNNLFAPKSSDNILSSSRSDPKKNVPRYRPAQIFIRSALEISSVPKLNNCAEKVSLSMSTIKAIALFFGKKFQCKVLRLRRHDTPLAEEYCSNGIKDESSCSLAKIVVADFEVPPTELTAYLGKLQCADPALVVTTALASMEIEERRRILRWHKFIESTSTVS